MKTKKINLSALSIASFITSLPEDKTATLKGGILNINLELKSMSECTNIMAQKTGMGAGVVGKQ